MFVMFMMMMISILNKCFLLLTLILVNGIFHSDSITVNPNGYILYCPCMGRFGNQAEQLLGSLQFAKAINRTIVLPPFIQYLDRKVNFIPFTDYIDIDAIREYHSVITLDQFVHHVAPKIWKEGRRPVFCYSKRPGATGQAEDCNPMEGNPYGPFWQEAVGVESFSDSVFYAPLTTSHLQAEQWIHRYRKFAVLAFVGAPSAFPTNGEAVEVHKYIHFSKSAKQKAEEYKRLRGFPHHPYIGVHLRQGSDWQSACKLLRERPMSELFSSQQCFNPDKGNIPYDLCFQSTRQLVFDLLSQSIHSSISTIYIASDSDDHDLWKHLFRKLNHNIPNLILMTPTQTYTEEYPDGYFVARYPSIIEDLVILSDSDHFIGNCISSFSAFVSRTRKWDNKLSSFFATNQTKDLDHDEL